MFPSNVELNHPKPKARLTMVKSFIRTFVPRIFLSTLANTHLITISLEENYTQEIMESFHFLLEFARIILKLINRKKLIKNSFSPKLTSHSGPTRA